MVCKINCAAITGVDVVSVVVETDICNGLPSFDMVGLLSYDIKEARERVRTAIKNSGFIMMLTNEEYDIVEKSKFDDFSDKQKERATYDFKWIKGQIQARRAAEIAAAGMHNLLLVGPLGTGKTVIAKTIKTILPEISREEMIEIAKIQSIAGNLKGNIVKTRPFRNPHHTATVASITGGGVNPKPGEITLAHRGGLYMDEFPEFSRGVMEALRQPLEDRNIVISRTGGNYLFPADFLLLAAMKI